MNINLYDKDLNRIGIVGNRFVSCLWSEGYNSVERFTLEIRATDEWKEKIKPDLFVGRDDRKTLMVIKSVEITSDTIIAYGEQASRILDDVAFIGKIAPNSIIDTALNSAYTQSSKYYNVNYKVSGLQDTYGEEIEDKTILDLMKTMCESADVGFRTVRDGKQVAFELFKPKENPNLIFSQNFNNLNFENITLSTEKEKNYAVVMGKQKKGDVEIPVRVDVDLTNGEQRKELIVKSSESIEEKETIIDLRRKMRAEGVEALLKQSKTWEVSALPLANDFGTRYDLGDVLTILLNEYRLKIRARLTRFTQKEENNKIDTSIEVGIITKV